MLKSFTVTNFKAFKNAVTLDFSATGNYEFNTDAIRNNIVKTAIMYGKNASGKSSLAVGLFDIVSNLTDKYVNIQEYNNYQNIFNTDQAVEFKYIFSFQNKDVTYQYKKSNIDSFISETLIIDGKTVISYDKENPNTEFTILLAGTETINKDLSNLHISALKWVKSNSLLEGNIENRIFYDLFNFADRMLLFWSLNTRTFIGYSSKAQDDIIEGIIRTNHFEDLKRFFLEAGFTEELTHGNDSGAEEIYIVHGEKRLNFSEVCSTGMNSLLLVYYWLKDIRIPEKCPSFICIDEFDAFYHFELSRFIVRKLKEINCQVLLTTHNTTLFTNDLLRPDCFYICSKDKIINAHNATEKELREGHNLEKLYRGGTFNNS